MNIPNQKVFEILHKLYPTFIIGGSLGLYLQGVQERIPNDVDIIVPYNESKIIKNYRYDFGLVYQHNSIKINGVKIDIMSMQDNFWKITKYYDHRIKSYVQLYPQIHYCIQYAVDYELTTTPTRRVFDLDKYKSQIQNTQNEIQRN